MFWTVFILAVSRETLRQRSSYAISILNPRSYAGSKPKTARASELTPLPDIIKLHRYM